MIDPKVAEEAEQIAKHLAQAAEGDPELKMTILLERGAKAIRALSRMLLTASQARDEVVEECAKVADEIAAYERDNAGANEPHSLSDGWTRGALTTAENIAECIRVLKTGDRDE